MSEEEGRMTASSKVTDSPSDRGLPVLTDGPQLPTWLDQALSIDARVARGADVITMPSCGCRRSSTPGYENPRADLKTVSTSG